MIHIKIDLKNQTVQAKYLEIQLQVLQHSIFFFLFVCLLVVMPCEIAGSGQYSRMRRFGEVDFVGKYEMADYSAHLHEKLN